MGLNKITFENKEDRRVSSLPRKNKVIAADINEIKSVVNAIADKVDEIKMPQSVAITAADFAGNAYVNTALIGKTPVVDFNLWTNDGSGVLLKYEDGYAFNAGTGTITTEAGNYRLEMYIKLT